jgi:hypothetical protein
MRNDFEVFFLFRRRQKLNVTCGVFEVKGFLHTSNINKINYVIDSVDLTRMISVTLRRVRNPFVVPDHRNDVVDNISGLRDD